MAGAVFAADASGSSCVPLVRGGAAQAGSATIVQGHVACVGGAAPLYRKRPDTSPTAPIHALGSARRGPLHLTYVSTAEGVDGADRVPPGVPGAHGALPAPARPVAMILPPLPAANASEGRTVSAPAPAADAAPDAQLSAATALITARINEYLDFPTDSRAHIDALVASTMQPLFDFRGMTQSAVAYNWHHATPAQQDALAAQFSTMLVRTYATALENNRGRPLEYKPLHLAPGQTSATVKSWVKLSTGEGLSFEYDFEKTAAGWKVGDIRIAGISLVTSYRASFAQTIRDGGADSLIKSLAATNDQADAGIRSHESSAWPFFLVYSVIRRAFLPGDR
jgi:phospholipid transport system substrate-binding protein